MKSNIRRQLTLFVDKDYAYEIERIRQQFNPKQHELIDSHVTLCREDEIEDMNALLHNLKQLNAPQIAIYVGQVMRFENGKGVLLPAVGDNDQFHRLRSKVLKGLHVTIRRPEPHITLMHPRNATCTDEIFSLIQKISLPTQLNFDTISLIEQIDGGKWCTLKTYKLNDN